MSAADRAFRLAALGFPVFPVRITWNEEDQSWRKQPLARWGEAATTDAEQISTWFNVQFVGPEIGVGVHTGRAGLNVVDVDTKHGVNGFDRLHAGGYELPETYRYETPSGGSHYLYWAPEGVDLTIAQGYPVENVDIRGGVGFVVVYDDDVPAPADLKLAPAPEWSLKRRGAPSASSGVPGEFARFLEHDTSPLKADGYALLAQLVANRSIRHQPMLDAQTDIVKLSSGWAEAIRQYRAHYLRGEFDTADWAERFDDGVKGIQKMPHPIQATTAAEAREEFGVTVSETEIRGLVGLGWAVTDMTERVAAARRGEIARPVPTIGTLQNGSGLFYARKVNGIAGASGGGKSWIALRACVDEAAKGRHSIFVDYEDSADTLALRLVELAVSDDQARFIHHVAAQGRYEDARPAFEALVSELCPSVVVVDSTGEALAGAGFNPNADEDVAGWFQTMPRAVAALGPGVVLIDHQVKSTDGGLWPIGSQRKRAAIDGVQYVSTVVQPFARGENGQVDLVCAKDRAGTYSQGAKVAQVGFDTRPDGTLAVTAVAPLVAVRAEPTSIERVHKLREELCAVVGTYPNLSASALAAHVGAQKSLVLQQARWLVENGYLRTTPGGGRGGGVVHQPGKPYSRTPKSGSASTLAAEFLEVSE